MRKIIFTLDTGICGTTSHEAVAFDDDVTEDEINDYGHELALSNAEMFGIYPESERPEDYDEENEDSWTSDSYSDDICHNWEDYDPEKHDDLVSGGGEWKWD